MAIRMTEAKNHRPGEPTLRNGQHEPLVKCPHCGRLVSQPFEAAAGGAQAGSARAGRPVPPEELPGAWRCPACGLPIPKERLA